MAAPVVTGAITLIVAENPAGTRLKYDDVYATLTRNTITTGSPGLAGITDADYLSCGDILYDVYPVMVS